MLKKSKITNTTNNSSFFDSIIPAKSESRSRREGSGELTVVNSPHNGKRVQIPLKTMERLGHPSTVEFGFSGAAVVIGTGDCKGSKRMKVSTSGKAGIVYNAGIVQEITKHLELNFEEHVCVTLYKAEYEERNGNIYGRFSVGDTTDEDTAENERAQDEDPDEELDDTETNNLAEEN